jgi:subfamily B ATP-binding cassette protein MsbA
MNLRLAKLFINLVGSVRAVYLLILIFFANGLELLGISLFIPIIELFSNSGVLRTKYAAVLETYIPVSTSLGDLNILLILLSLAFTFKAIVALIVRHLSLKACSEIQNTLRLKLFNCIISSDLAYFQSKKQGVLLNVLGDQVNRLGQVLFVSIQLTAQWLATFVFLIFVFFVSWKLTLIAVLPCIFIFPWVRSMGRKANHHGSLQTRSQEETNHLLWESFQSKKTISAMGLEKVLVRIFNRVSLRLSQHWRDTNFWSNLTSTIVQPLSAIVLSIIIIASLQYRISIAELGAFCLAFLRLVPSIQGAIAMSADVAANEPSVNTVFALLEQVSKNSSLEQGVYFERINKAITFRDVCFGYSPDLLVLTGLNLIMPRGKITALVGKSGAGKTTVVDLTVGLYEPCHGQILVDGIELRDLNKHSYRKKIAYVGQEPFLLHDSVRNNLIFGLESSVTDHELKLVCEKVGAWDFVISKPGGLNFILGDKAVQLSGGQRQRLALARALLRRPELLILDEATSALDTETEETIADAILGIQRNDEITILIVAHRYTTIRCADSIIEITPTGAVTLGTWSTAKIYLLENHD